ncbi:hypothetical protein DFQ28_004535 [Apophysomyces sp. BC1034]|nr:hypothetical protein DFQ28_004535 [Apophysomyces sp. BC1034]
MEGKYVLALDQGTTNSRAIVFDRAGSIVSTAQKEFRQIYPQPGWVEHDPREIWSTQAGVAAEAVVRAGLNGGSIHAIGITNQRETTIVWDRETGLPIYNAIVWQDRRTADFCAGLKARGLESKVRTKTGLPIDAYFSATKIRWILDNVDGARERAAQGKLAFGTHDAAGEAVVGVLRQHADDCVRVPDPDRRCRWRPARGAVRADVHDARHGQEHVRHGLLPGDDTGDKPIESRNNLVTTIAWQIDGKTTYALEGSIFIGGAVVQWLRDGLGIIKQAADIEALAGTVPHSDGVFLVPAFAGLGAPHWNPHARGTLFGATRGTTAAHIARAALDSIAHQSFDVLKAMEADAGQPITELRVDGGAVENNLLMQFQADILGVDVVRPRVTETTALGAAYLAGLATGYWSSLDELRNHDQCINCGIHRYRTAGIARRRCRRQRDPRAHERPQQRPDRDCDRLGDGRIRRRGVLGSLQRCTLESGRVGGARRRRQVRMGEGTSLCGCTDARWHVRRIPRLADLSEALRIDGLPGYEARGVLHGPGDSQYARQPCVGDRGHIRARVRGAAPSRTIRGPRRDQRAAGRAAGAEHRRVARGDDRLCDEPGAGFESSDHARAAADTRQARQRLGLRVGAGSRFADRWYAGGDCQRATGVGTDVAPGWTARAAVHPPLAGPARPGWVRLDAVVATLMVHFGANRVREALQRANRAVHTLILLAPDLPVERHEKAGLFCKFEDVHPATSLHPKYCRFSIAVTHATRGGVVTFHRCEVAVVTLNRYYPQARFGAARAGKGGAAAACDRCQK